jgi:DNA-binding ferritin-like protein
MDALKLTNSYNEQAAYTFLHRSLLQVKLAHYTTKHFPAHEALGRTYDGIEEILDGITEQLIGYSGIDPTSLVIGTVSISTPKELADAIISGADKLQSFARGKKYANIENLAQELSGLGATLKFLCRY